MVEEDLGRSPVNSGVMAFKPTVSKDNVIFSKITDQEANYFNMVLDLHRKEYLIMNLSPLVFCVVHIADRDGVRKRKGLDIELFDQSPVDKFCGGTTVDEGLLGDVLLLLTSAEEDGDVDSIWGESAKDFLRKGFVLTTSCVLTLLLVFFVKAFRNNLSINGGKAKEFASQACNTIFFNKGRSGLLLVGQGETGKSLFCLLEGRQRAFGGNDISRGGSKVDRLLGWSGDILFLTFQGRWGNG